MLCRYGMYPEFGLSVSDPADTPGLREAVEKILSQEMSNAVAILRENRTALDAMAAGLLKNSRFTGEEIDRIFSGA